TMNAHGLLWEETDGVPTAYHAYDNSGLIAFDDSSTDYTAVALDMTDEEVPSGSISASVDSPSYADRRNGVFVRFSSNAVISLAEEYVADETNFTYTVPSLPNASITLAAH